MAQQTDSRSPNVDKLEAVLLVIGKTADISVQHREGGDRFFTVTRRDEQGLWIGQGVTLGDAIAALYCTTRKVAPELARAEQVAA